MISRRAFLAGSVAVAVGACSSSTPTATAPASTGSAALEPTTAAASATAAVAAETTDAPTQAATTEPAPTTRPGPPEYSGSDDPFTLGVASGDPTGESVVHWTRLLPAGAPLTDSVTVRLEVFGDIDLSVVVDTQSLVTDGDVAHSIHALTTGLEPDTWYWYRFKSGEWSSPVGRSRTTPAAGDSPGQLVVGSASCQNWEDGFYTAHADIAAAGLDLVAWLGDYIYEGAAGTVGQGGAVRTHGAPEPKTLDEYRARYALYKSDPNLQAAHAACPWLVIWDDHEVENNYAGNIAQDGTPLNERRAAAYRAWWEHTPTALEAPTTADMKIYRGFQWGTLVDMSLLDTRQYRTDQACGDAVLQTTPPCPEVFDADRTLMGAEQKQWLYDRLGKGGATWNVLAQQVIMANSNLNGAILNFDQWDGYPAERDALLKHVADAKIPNFVVLSGDIHFAAVGNLLLPGTSDTVVGSEFIDTSISSGGNVDPAFVDVVKGIPGVVDAELLHRGWTKHTVTPTTWMAEYRIVDNALVPTSTVSTSGTYVIDAGTPGVRPSI